METCVDKLSPGGELEIVFFGGEPLLNWPLAKKLITHCEGPLRERVRDRTWRYHITTNLTLFPRDLVEWITKYRITLLCDIDGPPEIHNITRPFTTGKGSHKQIVKNISRLKAEGIEVALRSTITSHNVDHMLSIAAHHEEIGGSGCAFVPVNAVNSDEELLGPELLPDPDKYATGLTAVFESGIWDAQKLFPFNQYLRMLRPGARSVIACGAPYGNTPVVDVCGDVFACIYLVGIDAYKLGNIHGEASFPDRRVTDKMMAVLNIDNIEECAKCRLRYFCVGGCPVGTLSVENNDRATEAVRTYTREIKCRASYAIFEALMWRYAEIGSEMVRNCDSSE